MSGKGSVAASAIGRRGCTTAAACCRAGKNKEGPWQEIKQKNAAYRYYGVVCSRACRLVLWSVKAGSRTRISGGSHFGKIDRGFAVRKPERRQSQCLLCRRHPG